MLFYDANIHIFSKIFGHLAEKTYFCAKINGFLRYEEQENA